MTAPVKVSHASGSDPRCSRRGRPHRRVLLPRETMARALSNIQRRDLDKALERRLDLELVARRPWEKDHIDGVWQILSVPAQHS